MRKLISIVIIAFLLIAPAHSSNSLRMAPRDSVAKPDPYVGRAVAPLEFWTAISFFVLSKLTLLPCALGHRSQPIRPPLIITGAAVGSILGLMLMSLDIMVFVRISEGRGYIVDWLMAAGFALAASALVFPLCSRGSPAVAVSATLLALSYLTHGAGFAIYIAKYSGVL